MNRAVPLFLFLGCALIGAEKKGVVQIKEEETLKNQAEHPAPEPIKISDGVTITPLSSDAQELEALKKQMGEDPKESATTTNSKEKSYSGQIVQGDEDGTGVELFLYNDGNNIPILFLIQATGHEVGDKITVAGQFEGAMKFEGTYYPLLKSNKPENDSAVAPEKSTLPKEASLGEDSPHPHINGFQLSNILFVIFVTASLAIVGVRVKKILDERKAAKTKRKK